MKKLLLLAFVACMSLMAAAQENLYLIGDACSAGWDAGNALAMTKSGDTFTWTGQLNPGELKFLTTQGSWDNCYGSDEYNKDVWVGGNYTFAALTDGDRKFKIKLRGTYTLTITNGTINFAWTDKIYPVGDGCSAGWNPSSGQYLEAVNCCSYKGKVTFYGNNGEFKLLKQQDWGAQFGPAENGTSLNAMSGYDITTPSDDNKYKVSLSGEYDVVLDVYAGRLYVGKVLPSVTIKAQFDSNVTTAYDNSFNLYFWTAMGEGNRTMTLNNGWYEATIEDMFAPYNFLFNKAAGNWEIQTPNTENKTDASLCMHVTNTGVLTATISENCEDLEEEEEPIVRPEVKLLGINNDWATGHVMVEAEDQMSCHYTVGLMHGTEEFKIYTTNDYAYNGADYEMKREYCTDVQTYSTGSEPNIKLHVDLSGNYTFTYYYDTRKVSVTYPEIPTIDIKGIGGDWTGVRMADATDHLTATYTYTLTAGNYEFCLYKSDWTKFAEGTTFVRGGEAVSVGGSENATFTADIDGDYTFVYDYNAGTLQIIYPDLPNVPEVHLKGIGGDWDGKKMLQSADGTTCSYTYTITQAMILSGWQNFKLYYKDDEENALCLGGDVTLKRNTTSGTLVDEGSARNAYLVADFAGDYKFTYTYADNSIVVEFPAAPEVDLKGIDGDWNGVKMNEAADHLSASYTYTLTKGDKSFKVFFMEEGNQQWLGCGTQSSPAIITRDNASDFQFATGTENCQLVADRDGDYTFTYDYTNRKVTVTYPALVAETFTAHLNKDGFASIYMPYDFTLPVGVEAYKGALEGEAIVLTKVEQEVLPKETGLILYSASLKNQDITLTESFEEATTISDNAFTGTLTDVQESDFYALVQANNTTFFYHVATETTIPANRAYLKVVGGSGAPLRIRFATEVTTGIDDNDNVNDNRKIMQNGQIMIIRGDKMYNIVGQIVK